MRLFSILLVSGLHILSFAVVQAKEYPLLPEFTQTSQQKWFNSKPLTKKDLLGKVTLINFWTFDCWNCYRSFPWLHNVEETYKSKGFKVVGIHSPEFSHEKIHANIKAKIREFKISHPVMVDNDMAYWKAMNNRYWPAYYLVDKKGQVRASFVGETHKNTAHANKIEALIEKLMSEPFGSAQGAAVGQSQIARIEHSRSVVTGQ